ncbi:MAG: hypothetical protein H0V05_20320, partial [Euzebyaceae bacterium]|nr:hypothetical protein [Euzebyaceae bacterium]
MRRLQWLVAFVLAVVLTACAGAADERREAREEEGTATAGEPTVGASQPEDAGTAGDEATESGADGELTATFSNIAETPTLDPAVAFSSDGILFVRNIYEGLLEYAPGTTELLPALATEWSLADDGVTYTFTLRDDVQFHDGAPFDAEAARLGLERIREVNQGPASLMGSVAGIEAVDETTLVVTLAEPNFYFLGTLPKLPIVSPEALEANATDDDPQAQDWFATNAAGTGPYQLERWDRNQAITLTAFDGYWREFEDGTPTRVVLRVDPDIATAMQLLQAGEIDMMGAVGPDEAVHAESMDGVKVV